MMMQKEGYKYFDTTADIGIDVIADNMNLAFKFAAIGVMNLITDVDKIEPQKPMQVNLTSEDIDSLLYDWITELLMLLNSDNYIASEYDVKITQKGSEYHLEALMMGDIYDTTKYNYKTEVKAITYHLMEIKKENDQIHMRFIVDI